MTSDRTTLENAKRLVQATLDGTADNDLRTKLSRDLDEAIASGRAVQKQATGLASAVKHYRRSKGLGL